MARARTGAGTVSRKSSKSRRKTRSRTGSFSTRLILAAIRFSRPQTPMQALVLIFSTLGLVSIVTGVYAGAVGRSTIPLYWGVGLFAAALMARTTSLWTRLTGAMTINRARIGFGMGMILIALLLITSDLAAHALGSKTIPLLGPLSTPWLAYPLMGIVLVSGVCALLSGTVVAQWVGVPVALAMQVRAPRVSKVTRQTRIDRMGGSILDVAETELPDLRSTPVMQPEEPSTAPVVSPVRDGGGVRRQHRVGQQSLIMLPPIDIFNKPGKALAAPIDLDAKGRTIEQKLAEFGVGARVVDFHRGPTVTLFDVEPDPGVKVKRITELQNDLALALAAPTVRIQAPVPGRPVVGIEIPNTISTTVTVRELLESEAYHRIDSPLRVAVGKGVGGECVCIDLATLPHLLIAGATGSGKSVALNVIISSLLYQNCPEDVRLLMIDPKMVELTIYNGVPHLYSPVVTEMDKVLGVLRWTLREMERRFALFRDSSVRNLARYNQILANRGQKPLPYIVLIVDELADLMMVAPDEVEDCICRLAQLARATGIHLVIATQRPSVDVVTGLIKANFPARIAFAMSSQVDSRTILDQVGAEKLLGRGDMLYQSPTEPKPVRLQGALVSDQEIERLVEFWQAAPLQIEQVSAGEFEKQAAMEPPPDALFEQAKAVVHEYRRASVSLLQRRLSIGYQRAARLMDMLEEQGVVRPAEGGKFRSVAEPVELDQEHVEIP